MQSTHIIIPSATAAETEASSPESQGSASNSSELKQLREEVKFLKTLCVDQKRHIRWLKKKLSANENEPHFDETM